MFLLENVIAGGICCPTHVPIQRSQSGSQVPLLPLGVKVVSPAQNWIIPSNASTVPLMKIPTSSRRTAVAVRSPLEIRKNAIAAAPQLSKVTLLS